MRDAIRNGEVVALAESQMIRWIDQINGVDSDALYEEIRSIRRKIKWIKSDDESTDNAKRIRQLYERLNNLLFIPEYLLLIIDSDKDYLRACEGFMFNGRHYKRLVSTSNGVKTSTIIFASDYGKNGNLMREELFCRMENGRDLTQKFIPAKLEAYRSLACSASTVVSDPKDVLVVSDVITRYKGDYIYLSDNPDGVGEPIYEEVMNGDCENNANDGYGLIHPSLMETWSKELRLDEMASAVCVRAPFTKGMLFTLDFREFAEKIAGKEVACDIWGMPHNIKDVEIILTESMLKLTKGYTSWKEYWTNTKQNGSGFSVTKVAESKMRESRLLNYQFINPLNCTDDDIDNLCSPTIKDISGICGGDIASMIIYLRGEGMTEASVERMDDDWIKALMIDKRVVNDPFIRQKVQQLLRRRFAKAKLGKIRARGDFHIAGCDPYILCESVFGLEPKGLLKAGEVYSKYWLDRGVGEVVLMRAPMTVENSLCKRMVSQNDEAKYWYRYLPNIILLNAWDQTAAALNGCDWDGDIIMSTDSPVFLNCVDNSTVIQCAQKTSEKVIVKEEDVVKSNMLSFGDDIGSITNRATAMYDVRSMYDKNSIEYRELSKRLDYSQHFQQNSIDRAKGVVAPPMPLYFYNEREAGKRSDLDRRICVSRKPYFMIYRYQDIASQYEKYRRCANFDCQAQFECTLEELLAKSEHTKEETEYIMWYKKNCPVSLGNCTMNRICRKMEKELDSIKNVWKQKGEAFDYTIYRTVEKYDKNSFIAVAGILSRYEKELKSIPAFAKINKLDDQTITEYKKALTEEAKQECYCNCSNGETLCSIILDLTYGSGKPSQIPWDICGDVMIRNLLRRNGGVINYYMRDPNGEIEYSGEHFTQKEYVKEVND